MLYIEDNKKPIEFLSSDQRRAIAYLCKKRGIDRNIIFNLIRSGKLFQDFRGNCAFPAFDHADQIVAYELHGTGDTRFKGWSASRRDFGFTLSAGAVKTVAYFESAIDLLSFYQFYRNAVSDYLLVSLGGLQPSVVQNYRSFYYEARHLLFVDHDEAGARFAYDMRMHVKYPPIGKDWNEFLQFKLMCSR